MVYNVARVSERSQRRLGGRRRNGVFFNSQRFWPSVLFFRMALAGEWRDTEHNDKRVGANAMLSARARLAA